jgi:hypothetical protein
MARPERAADNSVQILFNILKVGNPGLSPLQGGGFFLQIPGVKTPGLVLKSLRDNSATADWAIISSPYRTNSYPEENVATNQQPRISLVETRPGWEKITENAHYEGFIAAKRDLFQIPEGIWSIEVPGEKDGEPNRLCRRH